MKGIQSHSGGLGKEASRVNHSDTNISILNTCRHFFYGNSILFNTSHTEDQMAKKLEVFKTKLYCGYDLVGLVKFVEGHITSRPMMMSITKYFREKISL